MREITRLDKKDIEQILAKEFNQTEDRVDVYVDADGKVVAEIEK